MPELEVSKLLARLAAGKPVSAVLLLGGDAFLRDGCRTKLVEAVIPGEAREWGVTRFSLDAVDLARVLQQAQTMPMLAPRQVVFAGEAQALERLEEVEREEALRFLADYLADPAPFTLLVFEAVELDQRMRLFRLFVEKALIVRVAQSDDPGVREEAAVRLAGEMARSAGVEIEPAVAAGLVDLLNGELARVRVEVEKLAAYAGERKRITAADVELLVRSEKKYSIWQLAEMLAARQRARALEFLVGLLRDGEEPAGIVGALAWMYRTLIKAQELSPHLRGWEAARALGVRPDTAELAMRQARRIPQGQLLEGMTALYEVDSRLKSGGADPEAVMEFLVVRLTAPAARSGAPSERT